MEGHTGAVFALCVVGHLVVSGSLDRRLGVWDSKTGRLLRFLEGHSNTVCCLHAVEPAPGQADPDPGFEAVLVSGSLDRTVAVWNTRGSEDASGWSRAGVFAGHRDCVNCVRSWAGRILSGSSDGTVAVWRPQVVCEQSPAGAAASEAVLDDGREVSSAADIRVPRGGQQGHTHGVACAVGTDDADGASPGLSPATDARARAGNAGTACPRPHMPPSQLVSLSRRRCRVAYDGSMRVRIKVEECQGRVAARAARGSRLFERRLGGRAGRRGTLTASRRRGVGGHVQCGGVYAMAVVGDKLLAGYGGGGVVEWDLVARRALRRVAGVRAGCGQWMRCVGAGAGVMVTGSAYGVGDCEVRVWSLDSLACRRRIPMVDPPTPTHPCPLADRSLTRPPGRGGGGSPVSQCALRVLTLRRRETL